MMPKTKRTVCIIQARMGSSRLPGKVMMDLCGHPVLWHVVTRVQACKAVDDIVVATTTLPRDLAIENFCREVGILVFKGDENDVLRRYYQAAVEFNANTVIRVTSDCPLIDPWLLGDMLAQYNSTVCDYLSNILPPRTYPKGLDAEIFSFSCLKRANDEATELFDREHVTPYIMNHPEKFQLSRFASNKDLSGHRWTLDTEEDYRFIQTVYNGVYSDERLFSSNDVFEFLASEKSIS